MGTPKSFCELVYRRHDPLKHEKHNLFKDKKFRKQDKKNKKRNRERKEVGLNDRN